MLAAAVFASGSLRADAAGGGYETEIMQTAADAGPVKAYDKTSGTGESDESSKSKEQLSEAQDEISDIRAQRRSAEERLKNLKNDKSNLEAYIRELDENLSEVQDILNQLSEALEEKQAQIAQTQADLEAAGETERAQYEAMKLRIQYMYEAGDVEYIEILFEARSLSDLLNRSEYIAGMVEYDREQLTLYQETCQSIREAEAALEQEYGELEQLREINEASKADLETLMNTKNAELGEYNSQINAASEEINSYTRAIQEQEDLIKEIEAEIKRQEEEARRKKEEEERRRKEEEERRRKEEEERRRQEEESRAAEGGGETGESGETGGSSEGGSENGGETNGSEGGGSEGEGSEEKPKESFIWPISSTRITSKFGPREAPIAGASNHHNGIDIGASTGTKISAAASGTVVISQYNYSAGNYVMISHGDGLYTVYMHCSKLLVSAGDEVKQGDTVGLVGSTGVSTAPHLHFGVRLNGTYVDPLNYVSVP